jgi:hypothetical protein
MKAGIRRGERPVAPTSFLDSGSPRFSLRLIRPKPYGEFAGLAGMTFEIINEL